LDRSAPDFRVSAAIEDPFDMLATGVGHFLVVGALWIFGNDPDPVSLMWGAEIRRSHNTPARFIPHVGKITENHGKSSSHKHW